MFSSSLNALDEQYKQADYEVRIKARILLYFSVILILFLPCLLISNLLSRHSLMQKPLIILPFEVLIIITGMVLLLKGRYRLTVNLMIISLSMCLILYIVLDTIFGSATTFHINTIYYVFPIIITAALFGSWRWLIALPLMFLSFVVIHYVTLKDYINISDRAIKGVSIDFSFALIAVSALSMLIKKVNHSVIANLEKINVQLKHEMDEHVELERQILTINESIRERIGQDLHDDLGQQLVSIKMRSEILRRKQKTKTANRRNGVDRIIQLIDDALAKIRRIARGLSSVKLDAENFVAALRHLQEDCKEMYGISCILKFNKPVVIRDDLTAINLYRIAQESITNAVKHGRAKQVVMELSLQSDVLTLSIKNNGSAYEDDGGRGEGLGIKLMRYRADLIGGDLRIQAGGDSGAIVQCSLPYRREDF